MEFLGHKILKGQKSGQGKTLLKGTNPVYRRKTAVL
jgi:hypothetical protein